MKKESVIRLSGVTVFQPEDEGGQLSYKNAQQVLSDVSLTVSEGEMVYFIGRVGSGKSTLLKTILGLNKPLSGKINYIPIALNKRLNQMIIEIACKRIPELYFFYTLFLHFSFIG